MKIGAGGALLASALICQPRVATAQSAAAKAPPPEIVFTGNFITLDSAAPRVEAVAVSRGRIVALGTRQQVMRLAGTTTKRIELPGFALPGFADAHAHPSAVGDQLTLLDLATLSKTEILRRVGAAARHAAPGDWIVGNGWDQGFWQPAVFPTTADLDSLSHGHPVLLNRIDGHSMWVNTRVLQLAGITSATKDPAGGRIVRDASGAATGMVIDNAMDLVNRVVPPLTHDQRMTRLRKALDQYVAWGLTSVHSAGDELPDIALYKELLAQHQLPLRVYAMPYGKGESLEHYLVSGPEIGLGDGRLTMRGFKVLLDGALGSRGAQLTEPYADAPRERGLVITTDAALDSLIRRAIPKGFQVNVHAIGDLANHRLLDAYQRAGAAARQLRFRDEHASVVRDEDVPRFAKLGVIVSLQPVFVGEYSRWAGDRLGTARLPWVVRTRDLMQSGAVIASGTDYPSSDTGDPILTLFALVTRRGFDGKPAGGWLPSQRVSMDAALRSMTMGPAYAAFQEKDLGAISVGRYADFTVLSADPYAVAPESLRTLRVLRTIVGGAIAHSAR